MLAGVARQRHPRFWHGQGDGQEGVIGKLVNNINSIGRTPSPPKAYSHVSAAVQINPKNVSSLRNSVLAGTKHISPQRSR
jgi:hypothetical protein